jgi:hypothetical protein
LRKCVLCRLMQLKISFSPEPPSQPLHFRQPFLLTGSCFSEHMAAQLRAHHFKVISQPNGVVFNPVSIALHLGRIASGELYREEELEYYNELWHSWQHHSCFSGTDQGSVLHSMNEALRDAHDVMMNGQAVMMITLGSAWAYELNNRSQAPVANCHKYPQKNFTKRLLSVDEIVAAFAPLIDRYKGRMICFTVSPVRHVRDGLVENNLSKAVLLQAAAQLCNTHHVCYYFPAYEIVMDELRDYRFYQADLLHPNQQAVEYVWQRFTETCMDEESRLFIKDVASLNTMLHHKIMHEGTNAHHAFEQQRNAKRLELERRYGITMT